MKSKPSFAVVREHIHSNVVGYIALFAFAVAGTAQALPGAGSVDHNDLQAHVVHSGKIHTGAVKTPKLADGAVVGAKIAGGAVTGTKIADNGVGNTQLAPAAVHAPQLAGLVRSAETRTVPEDQGRVITADCPDGAKAITGGVNALNAAGVTVPRSRPDGYGNFGPIQVNPTAWTALVLNNSPSDITAMVEVVCLIG